VKASLAVVVKQIEANLTLAKSLYDLVIPEALPAWHRVRAANSLANSGASWSSIVAMHNSGTYNNQYLVIDLKKFVKGEVYASAPNVTQLRITLDCLRHFLPVFYGSLSKFLAWLWMVM
jgi:hypothetical protein